MRVRVLYTNGTKAYDFFWVEHDGSDVYCGPTGSADKRSYHGSGKVHSYTRGERTDEAWHSPLPELKGQFHLNTLGFTNSAGWFEPPAATRPYSGRKSDAVLVIDGRSMPEGTWVNVSVGLLEPGNGQVLNRLILGLEPVGIQAKQVLLATGVRPWVYVVLYWIGDRFSDSTEGGQDDGGERVQ